MREPARVKYLDGWRGCAVSMVLFAHFIDHRGINLGRLGVELFFVLSGRLMAEILFVRETPLSTFFPRRVARIYPALFVVAVALFATAPYRDGDPDLPHFLTAITFTANYAQFWIGASSDIGHVWSLCIEEHMYVLLGIVAFIHRRRPLPLIPLFSVLAFIAVAIGLAETLAGHNYYNVYWRTDVRGASLLMGVIAYLSLRETPVRSWVPLASGAVGVVLNINYVPDPIKYSIGSGLLALSVVTMPYAPRFLLAVLEHPLLMRVGIWSYSMYLWQQPFSKVGGPLLTRLASLSAAMVLALVSFYLVEQPARRALNSLVGNKRVAVAA